MNKWVKKIFWGDFRWLRWAWLTKREVCVKVGKEMPSLQIIKAFFQQATIYGSRSTVFKPIVGMLSLLIPGTLGAFYLGAPMWVGTVFAILAVLAVTLFLFTYVYFMFKDPDALRSEKYSLHKMAIERGLFGDDRYGLIDPDKETISALTAPRDAGTSEVIE